MAGSVGKNERGGKGKESRERQRNCLAGQLFITAMSSSPPLSSPSLNEGWRWRSEEENIHQVL